VEGKKEIKMGLFKKMVDKKKSNLLLEELISIGINECYLPRREGRTTEIGKELNRIGGMELMLWAHERVAVELGNVVARELESAWGGIGSWQS